MKTRGAHAFALALLVHVLALARCDGVGSGLLGDGAPPVPVGLNLHLLPDAVDQFHARCLDGSPYGFYYQKGVGSDARNWVMYLQGGGLCVTPVDCYVRLFGPEGSSTHWGDILEYSNGIVSSNSTINPFASWNRIYLRYCSGDTWTGLRTDKAPYDLYFAGHHNLRAVISELMANFSLKDAETFVFTGASAGGIGVLSNADWLRGQLSPSTLLLSVPLSGYFFPANISAYEEWIIGLDEPINELAADVVVSLEDSYLHPNCVKARVAQGKDPKLCWDGHIALNYTRVPTFVTENMWDQNQVENELLMPPDIAPDKDGYLDYYGKKMRSSIAWNRENNQEFFTGLYQPSCFAHTHDLCIGSNTNIDGIRYVDALWKWVQGKGKELVWVQDSCDKYGTCSRTTCQAHGCQ